MSDALNYLLKVRPDAMKSYFDFIKKSGTSLDPKTRAIISVITKVDNQTETGFRQYLVRALRAGVSADEIIDALFAAFPTLGLAKIIWAVDIILAMEIPEFDPELLGQNKEWHDAIHIFKKERINVMPVGNVPPNPLEMLSSQRFAQGLEALKEKYDHIVIDSPPAVSVSDAIVLSQLVNQVIYLVKADATPYQLAQDGLNRLYKVNAPIVGVVLNQVSPPRKSARYGHYYSYYGYDTA